MVITMIISTITIIIMIIVIMVQIMYRIGVLRIERINGIILGENGIFFATIAKYINMYIYYLLFRVDNKSKKVKYFNSKKVEDKDNSLIHSGKKFFYNDLYFLMLSNNIAYTIVIYILNFFLSSLPIYLFFL